MHLEALVYFVHRVGHKHDSDILLSRYLSQSRLPEATYICSQTLELIKLISPDLRRTNITEAANWNRAIIQLKILRPQYLAPIHQALY